ncbi:hypothetical protein GCM10023185_08750 [Hymenobacter saemangeumensis]|uniref:PKD domain-containing protein n=1 Tax=Hymenobacter saemangeumensis TaxID=1084522 RepID=A0ABP8I3N1_9BACT
MWVLLLAWASSPEPARAQAVQRRPIVPVGRPHEERSLEFIPNRGQHDERARYVAELPGGRLFLEDNAFTYALFAGLPSHRAARQAKTRLRGHAVRVSFEQARAHPRLSAGEPTGSVRNYLQGRDPARWARRVPGFRQVKYSELWAGIDLQVYENEQQQLEYDFVLAPQADAARIALRYEGADAMSLDSKGNLVIKTTVATVQELAPKAWQTTAGGQRQPVACRYVLRGSTVSFALGHYDRRRPLTIDPTVVFSSYTGSASDNWGFTATYDQQGNLYSGGISFGPGYPTSPGAQDSTFNGQCDIALIKYNPAVNGPAARIWATYLGGSSTEFPHSIVANARGELVVLGTTSSLNFPVTAGVYQPQFGGGSNFEPYGYGPPYSMPNGSDLVISHLSAAGDSLLASTYLGGSGNDGLLDAQAPQPRLCRNYGDTFRGDVLLDAQGTVYLATTTASANFPTANSFGTALGGGTDAAVCALSPSLGSLRWSTLLGGSGPDAAYSLQLNAAGDLFVAGGTGSSNFPVTPGAYQPALGGNIDGFVARISASGSTLLRSTYLGTSAYDQAYFLQLDLSGQVYLLGQTLGTVPVSPGRYGVPGSRQYVQKLSANLDSLRFSTVFGTGPGRINLSPTAFLVDQCDRVYISGWGGGINTRTYGFGFDNGTTWGLPVTANAVQARTDSTDFYLAQFSPGMAQLQYATFFGTNDPWNGDHVDGGTCRFDPRGFVYHAVCSCGSNGSFPVPPGANSYSPQSGFLNCNNAAFKINFETIPITTGTDSIICATAAPRRLVGSPGGGTWSGPGVTGNAAAGYFFTPTPALVGVQVLTYSISGASICGSSAPLRIRVVAPPPPSFSPLPRATVCLGLRPPAPQPLTALPAGGTFSGPGVVGSQFFPDQAGPGRHILSYTYAVPGLACSVVATQAVTVADSIYVRLPADTTICVNGAPLRLTAQPPGGSWTGPGVSGTAAAGFVFTPAPPLQGVQTLTYTAPGADQCGGVGERRITVAPQPVASIQPLPSGNMLCLASAPVQLVATPQGGRFSGPGVSGTTFTPALAGIGQHLITYSFTSAQGCSGTASISLSVLPTIAVQLPADTTVCAAGAPLPLPALPAGGSWAGPGVTGSVASGFVFTPSAALIGRQVLTYTAPGANACGGTASRQVSVVPVPVASIAPLPGYSFCLSSSPVALTGQPAGGSFSGPGVNGATFNPAQAGVGQHRISYTYLAPGLDCPAVAFIVVQVGMNLQAQAPPDTTVCAGRALRVALRASPGGGTWAGPGVSGSASTGFFWTLPPGAMGTTVLTYTVSAGNCTATVTRRMEVVPLPLFTAQWEAASSCADNRTAPLSLRFSSASSLGTAAAGSVAWDFGDGSQASGPAAEHTYAQPGTYRPRATLSYSSGCQVEAALPPVTVREQYVPNIITPNGDGENDTFQPVFACQPRLRIYSRWGQLVYESAAYRGGWGAEGQPAGVYHYVLQAGTAAPIRGWLEVVK